MEPVADRTNRAWLCCVIFTDIVGYSKTSTQTQLAVKEVFNKHLGTALREVSPHDKVVLDTGDGAAICVSDPEEALLACLSLQSALVQEKEITFQVRIGINLGSVKLIRDLNGNLNAVGDGINVAQRVMSFAGPNQILVSRSFFEVAASLSDDYKRLFAYEGIRKDKHVKEHSVYRMSHPETAASSSELGAAEGATETGRIPAPAWPPELLAQVEGRLALVLGPIARILVRNSARKATTWEGFTQPLAEQIPTAREKEEFLAFCGRVAPKG
jgi:class 3 adenylate cyclase